MVFCALLAFAFLVAITANLASIALAWLRLTRPAPAPIDPEGLPPVSIVRPVSGLETFSRETLESGFRLHHPVGYELIFCAHGPSDPIVSVIETLIARHPAVPARLLIGDEGRSANPKLDNCLKGWAAARHDWVVLADSNVDMPADYLARLLTARRSGTGLVCSMPLGTRPEGFGGELECALLNGFQARWQYAAESVGSGYAQGKSMLWNKAFLDARGGLMALATDPAEDAAATKLVRHAGLRVHLTDAPFPQPIGNRRLGEVWRRQLRWARLRRVTFPALYPLEFFSSPLVAGLGLAIVGPAIGCEPWIGMAALAACWAGEFALCRRFGWSPTHRTLIAMLARDVTLPVIWIAGIFGQQVRWHGRMVPMKPSPESLPAGAMT